MTFIRRLVRIIIAYLLAAAATGVVVAVLHMILPSPNERMPWSDVARLVPFSWLIFLIVAYFAATPAFLVIALAEMVRIRSAIYFVIAGAAIGVLLGVAFRESDWFPYAGFGQGLVAGAIYWLIAGKTAGTYEPRWVIGAIACVFALIMAAMTLPLFFGMPQVFG